MPEQTLEVSLDRGELALSPLAAGERLSSATLKLTIPSTVTLPLRVNRSADSGEVGWISGEWGQLRAVVSVSVTPKVAKTAAMKVSAGGVWFTPVPPGSIEPGTFQPACRFSLQDQNPLRFPPLSATGLLLEIVKEQKVTDKPSNWLPDTTTVTSMEVQALNELVDLSVGLDDDAPFFSFKGRKNDPVNLDLREHLERKPGAKKLRIRAAGPVQMQATLDIRTLRDAPPPEAPARATLRPPESGQGEAVASWSIDVKSALAAVSASIWREPEAEKIALSPAYPPTITLAQLIDPQHEAAQLLGQVSGELSRAELWLGTRTTAASGTISLHPDQGGRPGPALVKAPWSLGQGEAGWVGVQVNQPLPEPLWLLVSGVDGEAFCGLWRDGSPEALGHGADGPWLKAAGQAWHRVRVRAAPPPTVKVSVIREKQRVELETDGPFSLDPAAIAKLNLASGAVVVQVSSDAVGAVELRNLVVSMAS